LKNALIPVRISFKKIKQITDDSLIYEWCEKKSVELMDVDVIEEDYNPDKFFDDSESEPEIEMEKSFRKQHCNTKVHEDDG
jgi:predicted adenine nucleotide alpha hydrolase (AANH) superfamily ATPase